MPKIKKVISWTIVVAIMLTIGFIIWGNKNKKVAYALTPVSKGTLTRTISANGEYLSKEKADISFRISGPLTTIKVDIGDEVRKGHFLASVDTGTLTDKLEQAKKAVTIQKETLNYQKDKDDLFTKDQRDAQKAAVKQAESVVNEISRQFQYTTITSPMNGKVAKKNISIGEIVQAGSPVVTIIREDEMRIEAKVPEVDIAGVRVGQKASVKFDAYPENQRFEATITEIDPTPITVQNVVYYVVKMQVENPDAGLRYGMNCTIYNQTHRKENVLIIPKGVVEKEDGKKFVAILTNTEKNAVEKKEVQTGLEGDNGMVEIVSGLKEGEQIATEK